MIRTDEPKTIVAVVKRADYDGLPVWKIEYNFNRTLNPLTHEFNNPYGRVYVCIFG